jgi:hypothetical protein
LYEEDFNKIDPSGRISSMYHSIPAQLSKDGKRYLISKATGKRKVSGDEEALYDLIDSKTVLISYNTTDPRVSLSLTKDRDSYKMYVADRKRGRYTVFASLLSTAYCRLRKKKIRHRSLK